MSWTCPKCERELRSPNIWHYCCKINIDDLFKGRSEELVLVFDKILAEVIDWPDVLVSATPNCVVFVHKRTFLIIRPMKKELDVKFYSETKPEAKFITKSTLYRSKYENHVRLSRLSELNPGLFAYIRDSYQLL